MSSSSVTALSESEKLDLVSSMLTAIHLVSAIEALSVGAQTGLEMKYVYQIIVGAAGNSWAFQALGAELGLGVFSEKTPSLGQVLDQVSAASAASRALKFPSPLLSTAQQMLLAAKGHASSPSSTVGSALASLWRSFGGSEVDSSASPLAKSSDKIEAESPRKVAFVGLGAMGLGMAQSIVRAGIELEGYDLYAPSTEKFVSSGGKAAKTMEECAKDADNLVLMVVSIDQAEEILFGKNGVAKLLAPEASIILSSTVPPSSALALSEKLATLPNRPLLVDAPVSGGAARAAKGDLTILCSGEERAIRKARKVLEACTMQGGSKDERLCVIPGGASFGSSAKLVNQVLAGSSVAASCEAMAFATALGLPLRKVFEHVSQSKAVSWMFMNRIPRMIEGDETRLSAIDILVKDLGIVVSEANLLGVPVPIAAAAHLPFLWSIGAGQKDDTFVVDLYKSLGIVAHRKAE